MATHSSVLAWRIPRTRSLVGCCLRGRTESDMTEATKHAYIISIIKAEHDDKHSFLFDKKIHPQSSLVAAKTLFLLSSNTLRTLFFCVSFVFFYQISAAKSLQSCPTLATP